jgi:adenosylcobyric acid synthase
MLGRTVDDPQGFEGPVGCVNGLGLLDLDTTLTADKLLDNVTGRLTLAAGTGPAPVRGYEIHMGRTTGAALSRPAVMLDGERPDGAISADNQIAATYLHGIFDTPEACAALLEWAGLREAEALDYPALREASLDRLADTLGESLDLDALGSMFA